MLGPTSRTASLSPDVNRPGFRDITFDELRRRPIAKPRDGLIDGGADVIMVETIFDTLNAKAALFAIDEVFEARGARLPVMISGTITDAPAARCRARPPKRSGIRCATRSRCRSA